MHNSILLFDYFYQESNIFEKKNNLWIYFNGNFFYVHIEVSFNPDTL